MMNGIAKKAKPPHISNATLTGSEPTDAESLEAKGSGTVAHEGKTNVTHINALASAPPWRRRKRQAASIKHTQGVALPEQDVHGRCGLVAQRPGDDADEC